MLIQYLGTGICSQRRVMRVAIFMVTVPATIMMSAWRGEARNTSAPKRARSYRGAAVAIISMAQQARPKPSGQGELPRAQPRSLSMEVTTILPPYFASGTPD